MVLCISLMRDPYDNLMLRPIESKRASKEVYFSKLFAEGLIGCRKADKTFNVLICRPSTFSVLPWIVRMKIKYCGRNHSFSLLNSKI